MILQKLCQYYDRVDGDPTQTISQEGFAPQKISFAIVINEDGSLHEIQGLREKIGKKIVNVMMKLPVGAKRTIRIEPNFLWDQAEYLLGWKPAKLLNAIEDESENQRHKREKKLLRIDKCFEASKMLHVGHSAKLNNDDYVAVVKFFKNWNPSLLVERDLETLEAASSGFGVFKVRSKMAYVHEHADVRQYFVDQCLSRDDRISANCLVTGETASVAILHPVIKGFRDQQNIVAFNKGKHAYESYGNRNSQGLNAPISETVAFKYTTALNKLLEQGSGRRIQVGETTVVCWSETTSTFEDIFSDMLGGSDALEDDSRAKELVNLLKRVTNGEPTPLEQGTRFYVLGLSSQVKARLGIRYWFDGTVAELLSRIADHQCGLEIAKSPNDRDLIPLWLVLAQTARESKEIQPLLGGALLRSVLTGSRYPESLLAAVIRRVRAEQEIRHVRAATIKAILIRNYRKDISIMLDTERSESAYHLGRLFASLERAQEDAAKPNKLNATIKDRYFGAASSTPATVFPRLIRLSQHHVGKLEGGKKVVAEKRLQEIMGRLAGFPSHLKLEDQGLFAIGYYHQRQDFFTKKEKPADQEN